VQKKLNTCTWKLWIRYFIVWEKVRRYVIDHLDRISKCII